MTEKEVLDHVIVGEEQAQRFGNEIILGLETASSDTSDADAILPLLIRFRAAGQLMSSFAETKLRTAPGINAATRAHLLRVLAHVDALVAEGSRKAEAHMVSGTEGN